MQSGVVFATLQPRTSDCISRLSAYRFALENHPRRRCHHLNPPPARNFTQPLALRPPTTPALAIPPAAPRIVAVSDIHGQYDLLVRLLRAHRVIDAQDHWTLGTDTLVVAGDVFDRGPQVTEAFWLLYRLQQQAAAAGGAVHFVLGNHETMVLYDDLRYVNPKDLRSAQLLGRSYPELYAADSVIGQWLRTRPVLLRVGDTLFLHGGIAPKRCHWHWIRRAPMPPTRPRWGARAPRSRPIRAPRRCMTARPARSGTAVTSTGAWTRLACRACSISSACSASWSGIPRCHTSARSMTAASSPSMPT